MSAIEFSEKHYTAIKNAADAEGMPLDEWVVTHLPLDLDASQPGETLTSPAAKPARTMADLFAGRVGLVASGGDGRLSEPQTENGAGTDEASRLLEIPEPVYTAIEQDARARGLTPLTWITGHLPTVPPAPAPNGAKPRTMAERLAGRVGLLSGSKGIPSSDNVAQSFAEHLEAKQREGRL